MTSLEPKIEIQFAIPSKGVSDTSFQKLSVAELLNRVEASENGYFGLSAHQ